MKGLDDESRVTVFGEDVLDDDKVFSSDAGPLSGNESLNGSAPNGSNSAANVSSWNGSPT